MEHIEIVNPGEATRRKNTPNNLRVNVTILDIEREVADKIVNEAAKLNGRVRVSYETVESLLLRGGE